MGIRIDHELWHQLRHHLIESGGTVLRRRSRRPPIVIINPFRERTDRFVRFARRTAALGSGMGGYLTGLTCWVSAIEAARQSRAITHSTAQQLLAVANDPGLGPRRFSDAFPSRRINSAEELDFLQAGCLLVFVSASGHITTLSHVMVAVGDGEAVGSNNGALNPALSARWQSLYLNDYLAWHGNVAAREDGGSLEIYAISLNETQAPQCIIA